MIRSNILRNSKTRRQDKKQDFFYSKPFSGGRIIDNLQIDNRQIDNLTNFRQIDNRQIDNRQIDNLSFSKIDTAISFPCPHVLGNWHQGVVI